MLSIGKLGAQAGVKVPTVRYYEQIGLLPKAERSAGNQRLYSRKALERLAFIRHARDLGFTLEAIRDLLSLSDRPDQSCAAADAIARAQLAEVEGQVAEMRKTAALGDVTPDIALLEELTRLGQRRKALEEVRRLREAYPDNAALAAFEE